MEKDWTLIIVTTVGSLASILSALAAVISAIKGTTAVRNSQTAIEHVDTLGKNVNGNIEKQMEILKVATRAEAKADAALGAQKQPATVITDRRKD